MAKGGGRGGKSAGRAVHNSDGTVTLATRGKIASQGKGSGARRKSAFENTVPAAGAFVQKQKGRGPVSGTAKV